MHCVFKTTVKIIILTIQKIRVSLVVYTNKHHYSKGDSLTNLLIHAVCQRRATEGTKKKTISVREHCKQVHQKESVTKPVALKGNNISRSKSTSKRNLGGYLISHIDQQSVCAYLSINLRCCKTAHFS